TLRRNPREIGLRLIELLAQVCCFTTGLRSHVLQFAFRLIRVLETSFQLRALLLQSSVVLLQLLQLLLHLSQLSPLAFCRRLRLSAGENDRSGNREGSYPKIARHGSSSKATVEIEVPRIEIVARRGIQTLGADEAHLQPHVRGKAIVQSEE